MPAKGRANPAHSPAALAGRTCSFLKLGGRGVDTAFSYFNQEAVGQAVREQSIVPRKDIFLTTKIECMGTAELALDAIKWDLSRLGLSYVDLLLIHAPFKVRSGSVTPTMPPFKLPASTTRFPRLQC